MQATPQGRATVREELDSVVIRFAGDSGDGMQIAGSQFTAATASMGNDFATFPDFPAEIRAPAGTTYGVSGYQIQFASHDVRTPGDAPDVLVAMNPAALKVNLGALKKGGLLIVNSGAFTTGNLEKAGYASNPLEDGSLVPYRLLAVDIARLTLEAVRDFKLRAKDAARCKNMWTLGLVFWLFGRDEAATTEELRSKFGKKDPVLAEANIAALHAGHVFGESSEMASHVGAYAVPKADLPRGLYRNIDGNQALAWGLAAAAKLAGLPIVYGSYPITPASSLLHHLSNLKAFDVATFQAEDEIAAITAAIGASFGGAIGVTGTSGPGVALKGEAIGLAAAAELPLVIIDVQRGGPSTGLPTKTEQSDLFIAVWGRNGDAPMPVFAAATPGDCFYMVIDAVRIATKYMTPVMLLTDGYIANGVEPWRVPSFADLEPFPVTFHRERAGYFPLLRDESTLARVWAVPGTPGLEHRIGGLEKSARTGHVSYDAENHQLMTRLRAQKVMNVRNDVPRARVDQGESAGDLVAVGWGSTQGAISQAIAELRGRGKRVSHVHVRNLWPLPAGLADLLRGFRHVMVPELNGGQLVKLLRAELLVEAHGFNRVSGQPFRVDEVVREIEKRLAELEGSAR